MPYVSRDDSGNINGVYANLQPGYAEEFLSDDAPEVVAFLNQPPPPDASVIVDQSYRAGLVRQADQLQAQGKNYDAIKLLFEANS